MADAVVIGGGLGAVRAAAALKQAGKSVVLLQSGAYLAGLAHPDIPVGTGTESFSTVPAGWRPVRGETVGLYAGDAVHLLPLSRAVLPRLFSLGEVGGAAMAWGRTRAQLELARLIGGGREVRLYKDWAVQHFGAPVYERLFRPYCERRFGDPEGVTANVARRVHSAEPGGIAACPAEGRAAELAALVAGVEVHLNVQLRGIRSAPGALPVVETDQGEFEGELYVDLPPKRVVELLGDAAPAAIVSEVSWLRCRNALEITIAGGSALPWVTHVIDGPGQAYRFVRHGLYPGNGPLQGHVSVQLSVEANDPLWSAGDAHLAETALAAVRGVAADARAEGARIQRVENHHPVWVHTTAARVRRYALAMQERKIIPVGRAGAYAPMGGSGEAAYLQAVRTGAPVREALRLHVEPAVLPSEARTHLTDFAHA